MPGHRLLCTGMSDIDIESHCGMDGQTYCTDDQMYRRMDPLETATPPGSSNIAMTIVIVGTSSNEGHCHFLAEGEQSQSIGLLTGKVSYRSASQGSVDAAILSRLAAN
jgi:hypothetical protein